LRLVYLLLFFVFSRKEKLEVGPGFIGRHFFALVFASISVVAWCAECMVSGLEIFFGREWNLTVNYTLNANWLKEDVDWLCWIDGFIHLAFTFINIGWCDFALSIKEMVEEVTCSDSQVACVFV
jgi:hypothetical protein